ncbi:MAG TPA: DEAD/DEAH box helicase [Prolixibacteraceae bacterium]|nr:DEAD/DEAH box helicase [Prolixibacteraceae bacterium]
MEIQPSNIEFVVTLTEHRVLGQILSPYFIQKNEKGTFYRIISPVLQGDAERPDSTLTPVQKRLVKVIENYSDENLARKFSRKQNSKEFFQNINPDFFKKWVVPYIDRQLVDCIEIIRKNKIKLFFKPAKYNNLYDDDLIEILEEPAEPVFHFDLTGEGLTYYLKIIYQGKPLKILFRNPVMLVDTPCRIVINNKLYSFSKVSGKRLLPFLEKEFVNIPARITEKYLKSFVTNIVRDHNVELNGLEIKSVHSERKMIITIERGLDLDPMLVPRFQYGTKRFLTDRKSEVEVDLKSENGKYVFYKYQRDLAWETDKWVFLKSKGLVLSGFKLVFVKDSDLFRDDPQYAVINWVNRVRDELLEKGIVIEQAIREVTYFIGKHELEMKLKMEDDWFDLYAVVTFGEFQIPFIRLKRNILSGIREYLLPNGEVVILPIQWFVSYKELIQLAEEQDDHMRFSKHHFRIVNENLGGIDPKLEEDLKKLETSTFTILAEPSHLKAKLRDYQKQGYSWMYSLGQKKFGGCLADDMGLGKTLQTLTLLQKVKEIGEHSVASKASKVNQLLLFEDEEKQIPASLIIVPTSLVHNWHNEIRKFTPQMKVYNYVGAQRKRKLDLASLINSYDIIITTYGTIRNDYEVMKDYCFNYLILDESQYIKNPGSKSYQSVCALASEYRLVLTGTPIENSLSDLWAQVNFLNKGLLGSYTFFQKEFIQPIEKKNDEEKQKQLKNLISPFILRRTKEEVAQDLPPLTEQIRYCEMSESQYKIYEKQKSAIRKLLIENIEKVGMKNASFMVLQAMTKLRQLANHPALVGHPDCDSGKFDEVIHNLEELLSENHKVLIFSSFVTHLKLFQEEFEKNGWEYCLLTGQTRDREAVINEFQNNERKQIFLISLKAGGVGLNLTSADYIFILDPWWNPASENQAISRAHRIGQNKKVFVYRYISEDTIEEKIQKLKERKSQLAEKFITSNSPFDSVSNDEIMGLFE